MQVSEVTNFAVTIQVILHVTMRTTTIQMMMERVMITNESVKTHQLPRHVIMALQMAWDLIMVQIRIAIQIRVKPHRFVMIEKITVSTHYRVSLPNYQIPSLILVPLNQVRHLRIYPSISLSAYSNDPLSLSLRL